MKVDTGSKLQWIAPVNMVNLGSYILIFVFLFKKRKQQKITKIKIQITNKSQ